MAATPRRASKRLIWIYWNKFSAVASTVLRGHQLADLAKQRLAGKVEIGIANETHLAEQRDSILVLTKGFLKNATPEEIAQLKLRGNIICADYVDDPEREDLREAIDVYIAASIRQYVHYSERRRSWLGARDDRARKGHVRSRGVASRTRDNGLRTAEIKSGTDRERDRLSRCGKGD